MRDVPFEADNLAIVLHNDDATPWDFVVSLLQAVFALTEANAEALAATVNKHGEAKLGSYPPLVTEALLETARSRITKAGHSLVLTAKPVADANLASTADAETTRRSRKRQFTYAYEALAWHFANIPADKLVATTRQFPGHMRADAQVAIDRLFSTSPIRFFGIYEQHRYETLTFAALSRVHEHGPTIAPAQYQDVDIGDDEVVKCLTNGLWLCAKGDMHFAVVLSMHREYGQESGLCVEIAVPAGAEGAAFAQACFAELEAAINAARSYRGKVLSFDGDADYRGRSKGILVHRLPPVARDEVILPEATLALLDRNVLSFVGSRDALHALGQSTRKGVLLYGPPGTGKTHTIRYLASNLPGHTTLIITAGQVGALGSYMSLARLLQPALVVIEDVDLIARAREDMGSPCEESLLNKLLNEMDGLKVDADILFVLTTNRPEQLEGALAGRPGRIDQAIEVPLPDERGREKLVGLYGRGLTLDAAVVGSAVTRTEGVSAAFIKELMRRTAQASLARGGGARVTEADIAEALDDMLFTGGRLNVRLLGGATTMAARH